MGRLAHIQRISVPTLTVATLLDRFSVRSIDLLQIDAEGFDFEIIKLFDRSRVWPSLIRFEHYNLTPADRKECTHFLAARGYRMLRDGIDFIAFKSPM